MEEEDVAKTIQEVSKFGTKALETGKTLGSFLSRIFGTLPEDLVGVVGGDYLHHIRIRNVEKLQQNTDKFLKERNIGNTTPLSPNIALPLLKAAQDESREALQELWARMLANAMDPNWSSVVRQSIIDAVRKFDPLDAKVLEIASGFASSDSFVYIKAVDVKEKLNVSLREFEVSLKNLQDQDCIRLFYGGSGGNDKENETNPTASFKFTHFGHETLRACIL